MWSVTSFIKLNSGSVCPANLLTVKHVETCLTPRIEALVLFHTQSNKKKYVLFLFTGARSETSRWERHTATTLSRFLSSEVGGRTARTLAPGWLPEVELVKSSCWCTRNIVFNGTCMSEWAGRVMLPGAKSRVSWNGEADTVCISPRECSL